MKSAADPFEVRCHRCDVSFPVETRVCMHCGGRIDSSDRSSLLESIVEVDPDMAGRDPTPIDVMSDPVDPDVDESQEPTSVGRSLLRSLGGFVWVIVLIGFTLVRSCGGE